MKKGWPTKPIGEVCPISNRKPEAFAGTRRYFSTGAVGSEGELAESELVDFANRPSRAGCMPEVGDIGFARMKGTKKVILIDESLKGALFSTGFCFVAPRPNVEPRFAFYFVTSDDFQDAKNGVAGDGIMGGVKNSDAAAIGMPIPPLAEQRRIVGLLDEAFEGLATAKANAEKNLQNARALFESHLQSVFTQRGPGWVEKKLGDVFEIGSSKRIMETEWTSSGVPFYGGKEIVKLAKFGSVISNAYISEKKYQEYASKYDMPRKGDILITARGTIGVGYIVREGDKFYYKDGNIISMRGETPTNPHFVLYAFKSNVVADQFGDLSGTTVRHLPIEKAKELVLRMPGFDAQNSVVDDIHKIEAETQRLATIYQQKLAALDALKKSLLHQAFAGEL